MHIDEEVAFAVAVDCFLIVFRAAHVRIVVPAGQHTAHFVVRIDFMRNLCGSCTRDQLVMGSLIFDLFLVFTLFKDDAATDKWLVEQNIDFIDRQPVIHQSLITRQYGSSIFDVKTDQIAVAP
ncbi:hypothetical protein SDC9_117765 [bioreactor metagenome]|uniref:Uncharacterized protein n=1 Tax=bioreactor metagenome TaxID=1076179 RepID=A0A645BZW1_9ZZZZ